MSPRHYGGAACAPDGAGGRGFGQPMLLAILDDDV